MKKVKKVWGEEHWIVNNDYCGKKLVLKKNYRCSMHHHKKKDEVFYVVKGKVLLEADGKKFVMKQGDSFRVKPGCRHRFTGLEDSEIIEFSTHHDDKDSYRDEMSGKVESAFECRIEKILDEFFKKKVLVVGDVMLDTYVNGDVKRISPEAPVQVVNVKEEGYVPGGAANVCNNLSVLGASTAVSGVLGKDDAASALKVSFKDNKMKDLSVVDNKRNTTEKVRVIGRNQQLLRIDYETDEKIGSDTEKKLVGKIKKAVKSYDAVVVSDYAKGVITKKVLSVLKSAKIPVIVDPKPKNASLYKGLYLVKPNLKEASEITGIDIRNEKDIKKAGKELVKKLGSNVLLTCGGKGMFIFDKRGPVEHLPTEAKEVYDVTGAGDTVGAVLALSLASGATLKEASFIANKAAGVVVGKMGTSTLSVDELKKSL